MFRTPIKLHYTGSSNQTETHNDATTPVTHVRLVLDSLTPGQATEISRELHDLCFTKDGLIRDQLSKITVRLREAQQHVTALMALDAPPHVVLRHVRVPTIVITKRGEDTTDGVERKSKKVAPTNETLRATVNCLMLPESNEAREFLCRMSGYTFFFQFQDEERQLDFGPDEADDDDDEAADQSALEFDQKPRLHRGRKTKADTDGMTDPAMVEAMASVLASVGIELKPTVLALLSAQQRTETLDWVGAYQLAREQNAPDLPAPPSYVLNPRELTDVGDVLEEEREASPAAAPAAKALFG